MNYFTGRAIASLKWYKGGGDILLFIAFSLLLAMFIGQERVLSRGDVTYWLLIGPALIFPLLRGRQTVACLVRGIARPLGMFCVVSSIWFVARAEYSVVLPLILLAWVSGWALRSEAKINLNALLTVFLAFYIVGIVRFYTQAPLETVPWLDMNFVGDPMAEVGDPWVVQPEQEREGLDLNPWGVLPGQTARAYGVWRISVTPNIATSGMIAFFAVILSLSPLASFYLRLVHLAVSGYFLILSFVRSALIAFCLFVVARISLWVFKDRAAFSLILPILLVSGSVVVTALAPSVLFALQDVDVISRLFLRGRSGLSISDIYRQVYRPWLWGQHLQLFLSSDFWMGQGADLAVSADRTSINAGHARSDSVSLPTRLLATYGLPSLAFFWFIGSSCYRHIKNNDVWAVSSAAAIVWLMMTWGSVFHPTNALFVLAIVILGRGSEVFASGHDRRV